MDGRMDRARLETDLATLEGILEVSADRSPRHGPYDGLTLAEIVALAWLQVRLIRQRLDAGLYDLRPPVLLAEILDRTEDSHAPV